MNFFPNKWPSFSSALPAPTLRVLSLGAGVQSSTLAIAASRGDVGPMPDFGVFADTGWEPKRVYEWLAWLTPKLAFPIYKVSREGLNLGDLALAVACGEVPFKGAQIPPFFLAEPTGLIPKQCSKEYKTRVVSREIRRHLGLQPKERAPAGLSVELWLGISVDEIIRAKRNEIAWFTNRFPLIEMDFSRRDCLAYLAERQIPEPPKSSCVFCPFRRKAAWKKMRDEAPEDFRAACAFDQSIRLIPGLDGKAYLTDDRKPLSEIDLDAESVSLEFDFGNECEGMCGV